MKYLVGTIKELWRYPVKSMEGELVSEVQVDKLGLVGDRCWAVRDELRGETSSVRKLPKLLQCTARYHAEPSIGQAGPQIPHVKITLPDGTSFNSSDGLSNSTLGEFLNKSVSLNPLEPRSNWRFYRLKTIDGETALKKQFNTKEPLPSMASVSWLKMLELSIFSTPLGRYYDAYPLHIVSSNSIEKLKSLEPAGDFQSKRFRPNILIECANKNENFDEFDWVGGKLHIGNTIIKCESRTVRCLMPSQPQVNLKKDSKVLRILEKHTGRHLGINASVINVGSIRQGDPVFWEPESKYSPRKIIQPISDKIKNALIQTSLKMIDRFGKNNNS
ncbi:MAG: MOSC N-terminal beta barrel domain-containing protein [Sinobacterium sp.]|nr:MOSC N-terminal beta barrel domain-containing protein [Sinobacterium sp.]